jgi:polyferredoxin
MPPRFQSPKLVWWMIIPLCILYFFLLVHWPYVIPFDYLGVVGEFSYYLISNYRFLLFIILWSTFLAHISEAFVARRICRQLNIDQESTYLWMIQTLILGFESFLVI